jgi:hypothetical protein
VSDVWHGPGLAPGPFGNFYRELGTPFFALAGRLQPPQ